MSYSNRFISLYQAAREQSKSMKTFRAYLPNCHRSSLSKYLYTKIVFSKESWTMLNFFILNTILYHSTNRWYHELSRTYSCVHCRAHLANHDELISKSFQGTILLPGKHQLGPRLHPKYYIDNQGPNNCRFNNQIYDVLLCRQPRSRLPLQLCCQRGLWPCRGEVCTYQLPFWPIQNASRKRQNSLAKPNLQKLRGGY